MRGRTVFGGVLSRSLKSSPSRQSKNYTADILAVYTPVPSAWWCLRNFWVLNSPHPSACPKPGPGRMPPEADALSIRGKAGPLDCALMTYHQADLLGIADLPGRILWSRFLARRARGQGATA